MESVNRVWRSQEESLKKKVRYLIVQAVFPETKIVTLSGDAENFGEKKSNLVLNVIACPAKILIGWIGVTEDFTVRAWLKTLRKLGRTAWRNLSKNKKRHTDVLNVAMLFRFMMENATGA